MELVLSNVSYIYKNRKILNNISITLNSGYIYGIMGKDKTLLMELIDDVKRYNGLISLDGLTNKSKVEYRKCISLIKQNSTFFTNKVIDEMQFIIKNLKYNCKDINKRINDSLKMVGLSNNYLNRNIDSLSESEKILVNIACNMLVNPKVVIFDEIFNNLDLINTKRIYDLIRRLKNNYGKIVIISSDDVNLLYSHTDYMIVLNNGVIINFCETSKLFLDIDFMNKYNLEIPYLVDFTYKARKKKVRLMYHKDILDLIKDVYKHV